MAERGKGKKQVSQRRGELTEQGNRPYWSSKLKFTVISLKGGQQQGCVVFFLVTFRSSEGKWAEVWVSPGSGRSSNLETRGLRGRSPWMSELQKSHHQSSSGGAGRSEPWAKISVKSEMATGCQQVQQKVSNRMQGK